MAKAITYIEKQEPTPAEQNAQAVTELLAAITDKRDALLVFLDVLGELHQSGILEAVQGLLKNKKEISLVAINQLNQPSAHRTLKNGMSALQFLGKLDPDNLQTLFNGVASGVEGAVDDPRTPVKQTSLWGMAKAMRDPEVNSSITLLLNFLRGMGDGLKQNQTH